jgi:hypothetical protein
MRERRWLVVALETWAQAIFQGATVTETLTRSRRRGELGEMEAGGDAVIELLG